MSLLIPFVHVHHKQLISLNIKVIHKVISPKNYLSRKAGKLLLTMDKTKCLKVVIKKEKNLDRFTNLCHPCVVVRLIFTGK